MPVFVAFGFDHRQQHDVVGRNRTYVGQRDLEVVIASVLREQSALRVVDGEHLLSGRELGGCAPRRIGVVLSFGEVVGE